MSGGRGLDMPDGDASEMFVRVLPDPSARNAPDKADRGWRLAVRAEHGGVMWLSEEQVLPERVDKPNANRILAQKSTVTANHDEQLWLLRTLVEFGGEQQLRRLVESLDHETAERWSVICAQRAIATRFA